MQYAATALATNYIQNKHQVSPSGLWVVEEAVTHLRKTGFFRLWPTPKLTL